MSLQVDNLTAILGPTNTGKTFVAFEKLFSYKSGIFGFPLRLLARENYDKAVKKVGLNNVALITGEEKIHPKEAKFFFCTVEAMPTNLEVDCVIIDEVQLASDYERGHIFTDRIINYRGNFETIFLGSSTIKKILINLFPNIKIEQYKRFSKLSFLPKQNISKLKPRSAIVAFNINKVYEIAENLRIHRGGAAVVLGSLSPRTRNAQVEVYEDNKVDYLVATDAIGMGLNLNINHICFSSLEKFDGRYNRNLLPHEIAQIAGRAGRYKTDGTFGYTKDAGLLDPVTIQSIESHSFDQIQKIYWRNSNLNYDSVEKLLSSLKQFPIKKYFIHKKNASDEVNFRNLLQDNEIKSELKHPKKIKLLWEVCRIPDFEKVFNDNYLLFLKNIFLKLSKNNYKISEDWIQSHISKLENIKGGISELSIKISQIRTWTYIANYHTWLNNPIYWQEKTRKIENELSDNLHESLTNKFVDTSSKYFLGSKKDEFIKNIIVDNQNKIILDGNSYGIINGFNVKFDKISFSDSLFSFTYVKKSLRKMIEDKIKSFLNAPDDSINLGNIRNIELDSDILIYWGEEPIGKLVSGTKIYLPGVEIINTEFISSENKLLISAKLQNWIDNKIETTLYPIKNKIDDKLPSSLRAIIFNCFENLGTLPCEKYLSYIKDIKEQDKKYLSKLGIRIGAKFFFTPSFMKKYPMELCAILWKVFSKNNLKTKFQLPLDGRVSFISESKMPNNYWTSIGYININNFAFRIDVFERVFYLARRKIKMGPFLESSELMNPIGCNSDQLMDILTYCGYSSITLSDTKKLYFFQSKDKTENYKKKTKNKKTNIKKKIKKMDNIKKADPNSPFAVLEKLL